MGKKFDLFISYHREDREWASKLAAALHERGVEAWLDMNELKPGEEWRDSVLRALEDSPSVVFLISRGAARSNYLAVELGMALAEGKRIIPVLDEGVPLDEIPGPIRRRQYLQKAAPEVIADKIAETVAV